MNFFLKSRAVFFLGCVAATSSTQAAISSVTWYQAPPAIISINQAFDVHAVTQTDEPNVGMVFTLYRNGVFLASAEPADEYEIETHVGVYNTGIGSNNTTFTATAQIVTPTTQTLSISAVVNETTPPTIPASLAASSQTATSLTFSWSAATDNVGVTGYEVKYDSTSLGTATGTSRNVTGLLPNIAYAFTVRARDAFGNWSNWATPLSVTLLDTTAPSAPAAFTSPSHTSTSVSLTWSASTDDVAVVAYDIYRTWGGGTVLIGTTAAGTLAFSDTHVLPGTAYAYHAKARDGSGNSSAASSTANVTTDPLTDADGDGIPDALETVFGIQGNPNPSSGSNHNLNPHRPHS